MAQLQIWVRNLERKKERVPNSRRDRNGKTGYCANATSDRRGGLLDNRRKFMDLPKDPVMLLSVINMKLRDQYDSLDTLCEDMQIDREALIHTLSRISYKYDAEKKQFI